MEARKAFQRKTLRKKKSRRVLRGWRISFIFTVIVVMPTVAPLIKPSSMLTISPESLISLSRVYVVVVVVAISVFIALLFHWIVCLLNLFELFCIFWVGLGGDEIQGQVDGVCFSWRADLSYWDFWSVKLCQNSSFTVFPFLYIL